MQTFLNTEQLIKKQSQILAYKKKILPLDMLGRTLSYNTFIPRICYKDDLSNLKKSFKMSFASLNKTLSNISISKQSNIFNDKDNAEDFDSVFISDIDSLQNTQDYTKLNILELDFLSVLRRLTPYFIIYETVLIDKYQILEAVIFGADSVVLDSMFLEKEALNELLEFAYSLGIIPIFRAREKSCLKKLLYLKAPLLVIYTAKELIKLLPNSYYIICEEDHEGVDCRAYIQTQTEAKN